MKTELLAGWKKKSRQAAKAMIYRCSISVKSAFGSEQHIKKIKTDLTSEGNQSFLRSTSQNKVLSKSIQKEQQD